MQNQLPQPDNATHSLVMGMAAPAPVALRQIHNGSESCANTD